MRDARLADRALGAYLGFALGDALGAPGTPSAVRVRDGVIASTLAVGGPEVLDLLAGARVAGRV